MTQAGKDSPPGLEGGNAVRRRSFTETLPVPASPERLAEVARLLGSIVRELEDVTDRRRATLSMFKHEMDEVLGRQKALAHIGETGAEPQQVECCDYLLGTSEVVSVRLDSGEVFARRTATPADLQEPMGFQ